MIQSKQSYATIREEYELFGIGRMKNDFITKQRVIGNIY